MKPARPFLETVDEKTKRPGQTGAFCSLHKLFGSRANYAAASQHRGALFGVLRVHSKILPSHCRLRHGVDRLKNARHDLVRIAFGIRPAIFQIALVTVLDEVDWHANGSATVG